MHLEMTNKTCALCRRLVAANGHPDSARLCEECRSLIQTILPKTNANSLLTIEQAQGFAQPQFATTAMAQPAGPVSFEEDLGDVEIASQPGQYQLASFDPVADFDEVQADRITNIETAYIDEFKASDEEADTAAAASFCLIDEAMDQSDEPVEQEPEFFIMPEQPADFYEGVTASELAPSEKLQKISPSQDEWLSQSASPAHALETNTQAKIEAENIEVGNMEPAIGSKEIADTETAAYREAVDPWDDPLPAWEHSRNEYPLYLSSPDRKRSLNLKFLVVPAILLGCMVAAYFLFRPGDGSPQNQQAVAGSGQGKLESPSPVAPPQASETTKPASGDAQQLAQASPASTTPESVEKKSDSIAGATANGSAETQWSHCLQALASPSADEADQFAKRLIGAGIPAYVISADIANRGRWFRVRIGGFNSAQEAQKFATEVRVRAKAAGVTLKDLNVVDYVKP